MIWTRHLLTLDPRNRLICQVLGEVVTRFANVWRYRRGLVIDRRFPLRRLRTNNSVELVKTQTSWPAIERGSRWFIRIKFSGICSNSSASKGISVASSCGILRNLLKYEQRFPSVAMQLVGNALGNRSMLELVLGVSSRLY